MLQQENAQSQLLVMQTALVTIVTAELQLFAHAAAPCIGGLSQ